MQSGAGLLRVTALPRATALVLAVLAIVLAGSGAVRADSQRDAFRATLSAADLKAFDAYIAAQIFHDASLDAYWSHVSKKRDLRRSKKRRKVPLGKDDYVQTQPPSYEGPSLDKALARRWWLFREEQNKKPDSETPKASSGLPTVADFLSSARKHYGFVPDRVPEAVFKERYAREALSLGLTGEQVVRVYALETSGLGTADMQAGIHPISRKGEPISTAIGYAQLLAANSINELAKHGREFVERLRALAKRSPAGSERQRALTVKAAALARMTRKARSIPHKWSRHVAFSKTSEGRGIHAINLDGEIGPWLQVIKLKGLKTMPSSASGSRWM